MLNHKRPIYLDHQATTPIDPRVLEAMLPFLKEDFGNAASIDHWYGMIAKQSIDKARTVIAKELGARKASEIIFTSGATEANNLALIGAFRKNKKHGNHIISTPIEHPSVLDTLEYLKRENAEVTLVGVDGMGRVDPTEVRAAIRPTTILLSVMFANNEIGTIQPIEDLGKIAAEYGIIFHCDAAQIAGHENIDVYHMNIDLLSFSAHKFYGPKGVGGLFVRGEQPTITVILESKEDIRIKDALYLEPILYGGGHERGLRSGTLNVAGIVGMDIALELATKEMKKENESLRSLGDEIFAAVQTTYPSARRNGHPQFRLAHNVSITLAGIEAKALIHLLRDKLSFSAGSACSTTKVQPSHVLRSIGLSDEECFQTIRLGLGRNCLKSSEIIQPLIQGIKNIH